MKKRIIKFSLLVIVAVCLFTACKPETFDHYCTVSGSVVESGTNEPIQGVTVTVTPEKRNTTTGSDGTFVFNDLDASVKTFDIQAQKEGYETNKISLNAVAGETLSITIALKHRQ